MVTAKDLCEVADEYYRHGLALSKNDYTYQEIIYHLIARAVFGKYNTSIAFLSIPNESLLGFKQRLEQNGFIVIERYDISPYPYSWEISWKI